MHYEVIYEDGSYSLANYENDEEALAATQAAHERATKGLSSIANEANAPKATRVVKVIRYEAPPGDIHESQTLSEDEVKAVMKDLLAESSENGVTDLRQLAARVRDLSNPLVESGAHESNYKAEGKELKLSWS